MTAVFFLTLAGAAIYLAAGGRWARFGELGRIMFILGLAALLFGHPLRRAVFFGVLPGLPAAAVCSLPET